MIKNFFRMVMYFIAFVAVGAVAAFLVYRVINTGSTGKVPDLVGKNVTEAAELMNEKNLFMRIDDKIIHEDVPEGHIISQNIKSGEKIAAGTEVGVTVSLGPETYSLPSFEGQVLDDAKLTLLNLGMKIRKVTWVHSDTVEKGRIIAQRPLSGNIETNEINFLVSLGAYEVSYKCPSFVNMTVDDARLLAKELDITLIEKEKGSRVIFQKPEAGAIIKKGDSVEVRLGRGWGMWF